MKAKSRQTGRNYLIGFGAIIVSLLSLGALAYVLSVMNRLRHVTRRQKQLSLNTCSTSKGVTYTVQGILTFIYILL